MISICLLSSKTEKGCKEIYNSVCKRDNAEGKRYSIESQSSYDISHSRDNIEWVYRWL
jgi:hypothetical protein